MQATPTASRFEAQLRRPENGQDGAAWAFVVLPKAISDAFPRRGRTSARCTIDGHAFDATLEPDGRLSHWFKVPQAFLEQAGLAAGSTVALDVVPAAQEAEPRLPAEFETALAASAPARATWEATTTIARIDWVHWIESAKQAKTRASRIADACDMLASGKKRVCCFDPSGYYSKSLAAPREAQ